MVFSRNSPIGRDRPAPRWSKITTRQWPGVEEAAVHRAGARAGPAMQEQHRLAARVAHLLPIHDVPAGERQQAGLIGRDIGKEVATGHGAEHVPNHGGAAQWGAGPPS